MIDATAQALAEPRRREILSLVRDRELSAGEIAGKFPVSWPAISQHLGVLKKAGLLRERREGTRRLYHARREGLVELRAYLDAFWGHGLERLKFEAERDERSASRARPR